MEKSDDYKLQTSWILWNHKLNDNNWKNNSYKNIFEINNLYDYKFLENIMTLQNLQNTMFFLMRKDIFPTWEDPDNRDGCCASFKVPLKDIRNIWIQLVIDIISENIHIDKNKYDVINGISIAPKKEFNIIKIWFKKDIQNINKSIRLYNHYINVENCRLKKHF
tara:strand:+ start:1059 stop:1550 length:492 start_codon:yes stop_codon:yes gene_type:complete